MYIIKMVKQMSVHAAGIYLNLKSTSDNSLQGRRITPKKGYKTITVKTEVYDYFFKEGLKVKDEYTIKRGVRSFSAYVTYRLARLMTEEKKSEDETKRPT